MTPLIALDSHRRRDISLTVETRTASQRAGLGT